VSQKNGKTYNKMEKHDSIGVMKRKRAAPVYKPYNMGQILLLPTNLEELIPANHIVRTINEFIDKLDISVIEAQYKGGGTSSYHPRMMLKVLLYAYQQKICSSRRIAKALREDVVFMWLSGLNQPDFRTINRFRGQIMREEIERIFVVMLHMLNRMGYIKLEDYFIDGTKVEANANRYQVVWSKNVHRYQQQLEEKVKALFDEIEMINQEENRRYGERDLEELGDEVENKEEVLQKEVAALNTMLKEKRLNKQEEEEANEGTNGGEEINSVNQEEEDTKGEGGEEEEGIVLSERIRRKIAELRGEQEIKKPVKLALTKLEKEYLPRAERYEDQLRKLRGRSSYAKTDEDATFMQMKNDRSRQPQLRPAYNIQLGTENQYVVWWSVHNEAGDRECFVEHLSKL
jgi:transposase